MERIEHYMSKSTYNKSIKLLNKLIVDGMTEYHILVHLRDLLLAAKYSKKIRGKFINTPRQN